MMTQREFLDWWIKDLLAFKLKERLIHELPIIKQQAVRDEQRIAILKRVRDTAPQERAAALKELVA